MTTTISMRCIRTEAGKTEIRSRKLSLSRTARTLLLIIDGSRLAVEWLALVQGATKEDLESLISNNLIESADGPTSTVDAHDSVPPASSKEAAAKAQSDELDAAIDSLTYGELYTLLTDQAKARFGLIKGYRLVLEVEKCSNLTELQALGHRFVGQIRGEQGENGLKELRKAIGI